MNTTEAVKDHPNFVRHNGKLIWVDSIRWKYLVGDAGMVVAYCEDGRRLVGTGGNVTGFGDYVFKQRNTPIVSSMVVRWIREQNK